MSGCQNRMFSFFRTMIPSAIKGLIYRKLEMINIINNNINNNNNNINNDIIKKYRKMKSI